MKIRRTHKMGRILTVPPRMERTPFPNSLLKYSTNRRVRARGLQDFFGNPGSCRPGALTGRIFQQAAKALPTAWGKGNIKSRRGYSLDTPFKIGGERGFTLLECLVYIGMLAVVLGFATAIFYQAWDDNKALRRNAEDIVRALHTGDQWRNDMRAATGAVHLEDTDGAEQIHIPTGAGEIVYTFSKGELRRESTADGIDRVWLPNVKSSQMRSDVRQNVTAWRWELELKTVKRTARYRPLFTFETVAGGTIAR
jgi:Tfp pilus assembly protein FimT